MKSKVASLLEDQILSKDFISRDVVGRDFQMLILLLWREPFFYYKWIKNKY